MLSIRLSRFGKKKQPSYRIVVCQKHKDPWGNYIESLGHLNYFGNKKNVLLNHERAKYWLSQGAQPSTTVTNLLISEGVLGIKKLKPRGLKKKQEKKTEEGSTDEKTPLPTQEKEKAQSDQPDKPKTQKEQKDEKGKEVEKKDK